MFGSKSNDPRKFGEKNQNPRMFGDKHIGRKISNTINKINEFAVPGLGVASAFMPELAPGFATIGTALKGAGSIAKNFRNY